MVMAAGSVMSEPSSGTVLQLEHIKSEEKASANFGPQRPHVKVHSSTGR